MTQTTADAGATNQYPSQVHFLLNDTCNAKCVFCGGDYYRSASGRQITLDKFKVMAANLHLEHFKGIILAGAGDPLLSPHFLPILGYMKEAYPVVGISVTTNGIALTPQLAAAFFSNKVRLLNISINAGTRETYHRLMQVDEFDRVCRNAEQFTALARQNGSGPFLQFSCAISRHNIEELPGLVKLVHQLGGQLLNVFYCRFYPREIRDLNIESPEYLLQDGDSLFFHQELSDRMVEEAKRLGQQLGVQILHEPLFRDNTGAGRCVWPETELMVGFDGEIFPCGGGELHFKEKVSSGAYHFGNVLKEPLEACWNNETYRKLRLSRDGKSCAINECSECAPQKSHLDRSFHLLEWRDFDLAMGKDQPMEQIKMQTATAEPLVSVIVPTYNRPEMLVHTLRSILSQSYRNFEIIVVNDAGADVEGVVNFLNEHNNITYVRQGKNRGLAAARNTGIAVARGKYIAYLDDDDIFYPDHLEVLVNFLENSNYKVAYTDANQAYQQLHHGQYVVTKREVTYSYDFDYGMILKTNFVPVLCFMHEKACLDVCGMFDESLRSHEDWDLWMRMSRKFKFQHIKKVTCEFSWREDHSKMTFSNSEDLRKTKQIVSSRGQRLLVEMQNKTEASDDKIAVAYGKIKDLMDNGSVSEAIAELNILVAAVPDSAVIHNDLGVLLYQTGNKTAALTHYESAAHLAPGNTLFQKNLADYYFHEAGRVEEAIDIYIELVRKDPTDIEALANLASISTALGRPEEAAVFYKHLLELDPSNPAARQALMTAEGPTSLMTATDPAADRYRDAQSLVQSGRQGEAILELEKLVAEYPGFAEAHNDLAVLYYQNEEQEKVLPHYQRAAALAPGNINFQKNLADYYYVVEQRVDEAIEIYVNILQQHPDDLETLLNLGQICCAVGRPEEAAMFFAKALRLDPGNTVAGQMLASLENQPPTPAAVTTPQTGGAASIIIVTYNSEKTIVPCLESVARNLRPGDEVIIIDNCSKDATVATVETFIAGRGNFTLIGNQENLGFSAGTNVGIRQSRNPFIAMLNPDTVVTPGWLDHLTAHFTSPEVAAVGPVSDYVAGLQKMDRYKKAAMNPQATIDEVAMLYYRWNRGQAVTTKLLIGFCLLVRRDVLDRLGLLDEALFLGNDDLELSWRLRLNGFNLLVATDTFIHHMGQQSFKSEKSSTTSRLVQESTDALYKKLTAHYGAGRVPTPSELWDIEWFMPTAASFDPNARLLTPPTAEAADSAAGLVSMVILTFNQLHLTKQCVDSIARHTPQRHEIVFIDNGSTDGTVPWLKELVASAPERYRLIDNGSNLGFAAGCNQGMRAATGDFILLLNNDVVVTEGWLEGMLQCFNQNSDMGIVGPMSNNISGLQKDHGATFSTIDQLDAYAAQFRKRNRYRRIPSRRLVGFCMLFRKELMDAIGLLDENFGSGNFEDDDFCLRAALAGFRNVIAGDVFIHHYGNQSFIGNGIDYGAAMGRNKKIFDRKWSSSLEESTARKLVALTALEQGAELAERGDFAAAVPLLLEKVIPFSLDNPAVFHAFAELLLEAKRFQDALEILQESPAAEDDRRQMELKGYCALGLGLIEKAVEFADRALAVSPTSASALNLKGMTLYALQQPSEARGYFLKATAADPALGQPYTNLGVLAWEAEQPAEALELFERGAILAPTIADVINSYHAAVTTLEAFEQAEQVLRDARTLHPSSRQIAFLLIDILLKQGKEATAMEEILSAISRFGIDDGLLAAAHAVREKVGMEAMDKKAKGTVSLCMITKNEEKNLPRSLANLKTLVQEIIIVDTGSTDRTKDIAKVFGARIFDFPWTGNFSDARNFSLQQACGQWILVMDADEVISPLDHAAIGTLVKEKTKKATAWSLVTRNYIYQVNAEGWNANDGRYLLEEAGTGWIPSEKVRLFANDSRVTFVNPVHELVEPSLKKAGIQIKKCPVPIHHYGKLDGTKELAKREQYYLLGKAKLETTADDPTAIAELAIQAGELRRFDEAIDLWQQFIRINPNNPSAYLNMGFAHMERDEYMEGLQAARKALELKPGFKDAIYNSAICELYAGDVAKGVADLEQLVQNHPDYMTAIAMLSIGHCCNGNKEKAKKYFTQLRGMNFACGEYLHRHALRLHDRGRTDEAIAILEAAMESDNGSRDIMELLSECYRKVA